MACHCVDWATGLPGCIGIIGDGSIARCRIECRLRGMGVLCHSGFGDCGLDSCGDGQIWSAEATYTLVSVGFTQPNEFCSARGNFLEAHFPLTNYTTSLELICAKTKPPNDLTVTYPIGARQTCWYVNWVTWITKIAFAAWEGPYGYCAPSKTPCCYPDPAHPGSTLCAFITPAECLRRCGQFFEGTIAWANPDDPCRLTGNAYPCNIRPCCRDSYPHPPLQQDIDQMGGSESYGIGGRYCRDDTVQGCLTLGGAPNPNARSCYSPDSCDRQFVDDLHCVRGDWMPTYRPASTPPLMKPWIEGSAEIVSEKPERAMAPLGGLGDCKNHYGDVVYSFVEHSTSADAMGAICAKRGSGIIDPGQACRRYYEQDLCPVFYGPDGDARFRCEYRVA
jgi:hypothetical protein